MAAGQVAFVAPLAASRVPAGLFAALPSGAGTEVDYTARRDAGKPAAARGTYRVLEDDGMDIRGPQASDPVVHLRRILVYSSANAAGQAKARALKLAKAAGNWTSWYVPLGPGSTPPAMPWPRASRRSPPNGAWGSTCAPPSPPARPASLSWPGTSTRMRSTPKPPGTAGTRC